MEKNYILECNFCNEISKLFNKANLFDNCTDAQYVLLNISKTYYKRIFISIYLDSPSEAPPDIADI